MFSYFMTRKKYQLLLLHVGAFCATVPLSHKIPNQNISVMTVKPQQLCLLTHIATVQSYAILTQSQTLLHFYSCALCAGSTFLVTLSQSTVKQSPTDTARSQYLFSPVPMPSNAGTCPATLMQSRGSRAASHQPGAAQPLSSISILTCLFAPCTSREIAFQFSQQTGYCLQTACHRCHVILLSQEIEVDLCLCEERGVWGRGCVVSGCRRKSTVDDERQ